MMSLLATISSTQPSQQTDLTLQTINPTAHDTTYAVAKFLLGISNRILGLIGLAGNETAETWIYAIVVLSIALLPGISQNGLYWDYFTGSDPNLPAICIHTLPTNGFSQNFAA